MKIRQALIECAEAFAHARQGDRALANEAARGFVKILETLPAEIDRKGIFTKVGLGMGSFADVPWIAVRHEELKADPSYYFGYLFSKDSQRIYLVMCLAAGSSDAANWKAADRQRIERCALLLRARCDSLVDTGFTLGNDLDLGSSLWRAQSYATATAAYKMYDVRKMPLDKELAHDFLAVFECFTSLVREGFVPQESKVKSLSVAIPTSKFSYSLLSKPFLILTGPSGTGKTRVALELAKTVCNEGNWELVAVGADWTDNRHVLGYLNPLEKRKREKDEAEYPIYETTPILELILSANENPDAPFLLILDEMNLSHVERYFADFLSAMELPDKQGALNLHAAELAISRSGREVPGKLDFPENLFVIGTVNVDETTYMFSPKVLDRANVIEIHVEVEELKLFLKGTASEAEEPETKDYGISFLQAARLIRQDEGSDQIPQLPPEIREKSADHLLALFRIMQRGRGEFGFRTGKEVLAYLRSAHFLAGPEPEGRAAWTQGNWRKALDAQILQKILPKLHGNRSRLAPLLGALATYCATGDEVLALQHFPENGAPAKRVLQEARSLEDAKFDKSFQKLQRMIEVLVEEQFASFIC